MSPIEITLIIMLFLLIGSGIVTFVWKMEQKDERIGKKNLRILDEKEKKHCSICSKNTNVQMGDVFYKDNWFCRSCWLEATNLNINDKEDEEKWESKR